MFFKAVSLRGIACASTIAFSFAQKTRCRVAVCFSGAIRSLVHPAVHSSIRTNLIEAIEADGCEVDVFAYATRKDTVGSDKKLVNSEFTPNTSEIETALAILAPKRLVWHQEQAGVIPNSCPNTAAPSDGGDHGHDDNSVWDSSNWQTFRADAGVGLYWQLYKSLAAYRMALREEKRKGDDFSYDWILRARFDMAWVRPLPPLRSFSQESVWFSQHFWPMSDHFAMVPRAFSDRFFAAIRAFYACDGQSWPPPVSWWQPGCRIGFEESVLFRHLHASEVPYRTYFMFEYVITRGALGGVCYLGHVTFTEACNTLAHTGEFRPPFNSQDCTEVLAEWADLRCRALLPAKGMGDARRKDILSTSDPRAWEQLVEPSSQIPTPAAVEVAAVEAAVQVGEGRQRDRPSDTLQYTTVPSAEDVDRVRSKLVLLRDSMLTAVQRQSEGSTPSIFDNFEAKNSTRSSRWDAWQTLPPWSVCSNPECPLAEPQFPGLSPHIITYYTMGTPLVKEVAQALRCFVHSLVVEETQEGGNYLDESSSCEGIRPLEMVMIDVALHTEELGICTADGTLGLNAVDHVQRFFREPAVNCKGYGNMGEQQ